MKMPEDAKKNQSKSRNDPKEQRRKRQSRQPASNDKKIEKGPECPKVPVTENQPPPVYEPPPEFYKNLKRETDEIVKITEEENAKYKKKEIKSNWAKYEMPVETYEEIDEHESLGADYQALIDASLSVGGHFQFKHEKSWDANSGPSPYDKYFDINMDNLNLALCSIPFYERNNIDIDIFNETDIQTMNHRSVKYKQKYYNDKKYTTPKLDAQDKENYQDKNDIVINENIVDIVMDNKKIQDKLDPEICLPKDQLDPEICLLKDKLDPEICLPKDQLDPEFCLLKDKLDPELCLPKDQLDSDICLPKDKLDPEICLPNDEISKEISGEETKKESNIVENTKIKELEPVKEQSQSQVIESPEDLEKWLDDFLDG